MSNCNATTSGSVNSFVSPFEPSINCFLSMLNSFFANANALLEFSSFWRLLNKNKVCLSRARLHTYSPKGECRFKMSIHSAPTTTSFLDVLLVVVVVVVIIGGIVVGGVVLVLAVVRDGRCWSRRPPGRRLVAFSACASCLAMSRRTCPRRAAALVLFPFVLLLLKEGVASSSTFVVLVFVCA